MDADTFKAALARFPSGVTIITTIDTDGQAVGLTATSFASLSLDPPLVLFCLAESANCFAAFQQANGFGVNILAAGQDGLSNKFASRGEDKFLGVQHRPGMLGNPMLEDALATMDCKIVQRHAGGDHVIYIGEVQSADLGDGKPLVYFQGKYHTV